MSGMDMMFGNMLSNMIGMKPDELQAAVKKTIATIEEFAASVKEMNERLAKIEDHLGVTENATGTNGTGKLAISNNRNIQL